MSAEPNLDRLNELRRWIEHMIEHMKVIRDEVRSLLLGSLVFWEVQAILTANPQALRHRLFNDWMATNYSVATAIGIRRQLDHDPRSISLRNLLAEIETEIQLRPSVLSRAGFIANFHHDLAFRGNAEFDRLVGAGEIRVEPGYVRRDLTRLDEVTEKITYYVNKRIAHRDPVDVQKRKLGELDDALQLLEEIVDRYSRLLTGYGGSVSPELPVDWKSVFSVAWLMPSSQH